MYIAPCYVAGTNAEAVGESCILHMVLYFVPVVDFICQALVRKKIRERQNIPVRKKHKNAMIKKIHIHYGQLVHVSLKKKFL